MKLKLPAGPFRAYLFDCDGTIVDSMPLHYIAWKQALGEWGCTFDEELFYAWGGKPAAEIIATLNQMHGLHMPVEAVAEHKENLYFELLPQLKPVPEVLEIIEAAARPDSLRRGLRRQAPLRGQVAHHRRPLDRFETIVGAEDYTNSKPAPDAYLLAAARLGVAPQTASSLKTRTWEFSQPPRPEWPRSKFPPPWKEAWRKTDGKKLTGTQGLSAA